MRRRPAIATGQKVDRVADALGTPGQGHDPVRTAIESALVTGDRFREHQEAGDQGQGSDGTESESDLTETAEG